MSDSAAKIGDHTMTVPGGIGRKSPLLSTSPATAYTDGGVVGRNPSQLGGTWAWCHVDMTGNRIRHDCGIVRPETAGLETISNNYTELLAAVRCLESLPDGWAGTIHTDSYVTLCRLTGRKPKFNGIPDDLKNRTLAQRERLAITAVLLAGHPTKAELAAGRRERNGLPVSAHNVFCDELCRRVSFHQPSTRLP